MKCLVCRLRISRKKYKYFFSFLQGVAKTTKNGITSIFANITPNFYDIFVFSVKFYAFYIPMMIPEKCIVLVQGVPKGVFRALRNVRQAKYFVTFKSILSLIDSFTLIIFIYYGGFVSESLSRNPEDTGSKRSLGKIL